VHCASLQKSYGIAANNASQTAKSYEAQSNPFGRKLERTTVC